MLTASMNDFVSEVSPGDTRIATGRPSGSVSSPYSICRTPRFLSREYPKAASSQQRPSTQELDRSNTAIPSFQVPAGQGRLDDFLAFTEPVHCGVHLIGARLGNAEVGPECRAFHQPTVDSFDVGCNTRARINPYASVS
jgi:hypothetical protein